MSGDDFERLRKINEQLLRQLSVHSQESIRPLIPKHALFQIRLPVGFQTATRELATHVDRLVKSGQLERIIETTKRVAEQLIQGLPANWRELESDDVWRLVGDLDHSTIATAWVPRGEILLELLNADGRDAQEGVLLANRESILDDVDAVIADVPDTRIDGHSEARDFAIEAIAAAKAGFDQAAQALLASALTVIVQESLGYAKLADARSAFEDPELDEVSVTGLGIAALQIVTYNALTGTWDKPDGFNRHGTQHGILDHFSEVALLEVALLVGGWVRELSAIAERRPDEFGFDT